MTNHLVLPLLALVLTILAALFPIWRRDQPPSEFRKTVVEVRAGSILTALFIVLFTIATILWPATFIHGGAIAISLAIGGLAGVFAAAAGEGRGTFAFGMAVLAVSALGLPGLPSDAFGQEQVALVVGAFVAAFATAGIDGKRMSGYLCALATLFVVSTDFLGRLASPAAEASALAGSSLGIALLASAVLGGIVARFSDSALVRNGLGVGALLLIGYLACWKFLGSAELASLWLGGVVVGSIVYWLIEGADQADSFRFVMATVIWLGTATVAFGLDLGFGMAVTLLGGAATLVILGNPRALLTMSVAGSILIYRLFRELFPEEAKALDIGQHYTMIGMAVGALLPLLPSEWAPARTLSGWRSMLGLLIWLGILLGIPVAAGVLLGSKGAIGMVVGLSFASVVEGLRGRANLASAGIAAGIGTLIVLSYGWLGNWTDLERSDKVHAVIVVGSLAIVLGGCLLALSMSPRPREAARES